MRISFMESIEIASHIERVVNKMNIPKLSIKEKIYLDIEYMIKREFGLDKKLHKLDRKYLPAIHEFLDSYELPTYLQEQVDICNSQSGLCGEVA